MRIVMPGIERSTAISLVDEARQICPFSKALPQFLDVTVELD
jgi:organic hydroperoxide reductase OsmC/OhrA